MGWQNCPCISKKWDLLKEYSKGETKQSRLCVWYLYYVCTWATANYASRCVLCIFMSLFLKILIHSDVQTLEELSLSVLSRLEEVVKEQRRWRQIAEAHIQLLRDFAFQEWLCSQNLEHFYHT